MSVCVSENVRALVCVCVSLSVSPCVCIVVVLVVPLTKSPKTQLLLKIRSLSVFLLLLCLLLLHPRDGLSLDDKTYYIRVIQKMIYTLQLLRPRPPITFTRKKRTRGKTSQTSFCSSLSLSFLLSLSFSVLSLSLTLSLTFSVVFFSDMMLVSQLFKGFCSWCQHDHFLNS